MTQKIRNVVVGQQPTLLHASLANKLIDRVNALGFITIEKGETDEVIYSEDGIKIIYAPVLTGYVEKDIVVCEDGYETTLTMLVKESSS